MNTVILSDGTSYYIPNSDLSFFKELALRSNYSAVGADESSNLK